MHKYETETDINLVRDHLLSSDLRRNQRVAIFSLKTIGEVLYSRPRLDAGDAHDWHFEPDKSGMVWG